MQFGKEYWEKKDKPKHKVVPMNDAFGRWFSGFTDGEGSFGIIIQKPKYPKMKYKFRIWPRFSIYLHEDDLSLLKEIQQYLDCYVGIAHEYIRKRCWLQVSRVSRCKKVIKIFDKYPLRSKKKQDYEIWKQIIQILENTDRHTCDGRHPDEILKIAKLRDQMNKKGKKSKWTYERVAQELKS